MISYGELMTQKLFPELDDMAIELAQTLGIDEIPSALIRIRTRNDKSGTCQWNFEKEVGPMMDGLTGKRTKIMLIMIVEFSYRELPGKFRLIANLGFSPMWGFAVKEADALNKEINIYNVNLTHRERQEQLYETLKTEFMAVWNKLQKLADELPARYAQRLAMLSRAEKHIKKT